MMRRKVSKRLTSLLLCIALIVSYIPVYAGAATTGNSTSVADLKTLGNWENWFPTDSSRFAGSVYLDKSVYTATEAKTDNYFADISNKLSFGTDNFGNENFMVALSAVGSNSEVIGYSYIPTDTMLVLDASTSMGTGSAATTSIDDMVAGANNAIKRLLSLNNYNRVGVVIYNGNSSILLPLDRYTSRNTNGDILTYTRRNSQNRIYIASDVFDGNNNAVDTDYIAQAQGTYTQGGIYTATQQFLNADTVIEDGKIQGGTSRIPIMVLMTDGEPSYRTTTGSNTTINKYNAATNGNADRTNFREDDVTAFSTMLTAAWAEGEISDHYNAQTRFYTLGYALSANHQYAQNVLDPMNPNNALATRFTGYAQQYLALDQNETAAIRNEYNQTAFRVTRISSPDKVKSLDYVDKYWQASGASQLTSAFDEIVDEIVIQSRYYSTLVSGSDFNQDGFISFTDEIGSYMEVKDIKGLYIGEETLVCGGMFAEFATTGQVTDFDNTNYTQEELDGFENEILSAIAKRLNISLSEAYLLIDTAIEKGYISYSSTTNFSNYIAWYADEENKYVGPYADGNIQPQSDAKYIVRSYLFMGDVTQNHVETSMLYASVRVREDIATGRQIVDMEIPASLLPLITYSISVNGDVLKSDNITGITSSRKKPISLLYEVGLDSEITPINITEKVGESFRKDSNGVYTFYTNRWRANDGTAFTMPTNPDPHIFHHGIMNTTVAHFIPSLENQRYYFTENAQILDSSYNVYTGAKPNANGTYYVVYNWVEGDGNSAILKSAYDRVSDNILNDSDNIIQIDGKQGWFVKKGTPQYYFGDEVHGEGWHDHKETAENKTGTLQFSTYPQVAYHQDEGHTGYHILNYLGNNGRINATPTQGIKLTKTVSETVAGAPDSFVFEIALSNGTIVDEYPVYIERANGTKETITRDVVDNKLTVTLGDGDVAYITGIAPNVHYEVTEQYSAYYAASGTNASGDIAEHIISAVNFVNSPKGFGSLLVEKDVTHPFAAISNDLANIEFDFTATFTGDPNELAQIVVSDNTITPAVNGNIYTYTFKLKDGHDVLFTHIPEGIAYSVTENNIPAGFTPNQINFSGGIAKDNQAQALFVNHYTPEGVAANVVIQGQKILNGRVWDPSIDDYYVALREFSYNDQGDAEFKTPVIVPVDKTSQAYTIDMSSLPKYQNVGTYNYVVYEYISNEASRVENVYYDASFALFSVTVIDDGSGTLKIDNVTVHQNTATISQTATGWTIEKGFVNTYNVAPLHIPVNKAVVSEQNNTALTGHSGGFVFGLYESTTAETPVYTTMTDSNGNAEFILTVKQSDYTTTKYFYIREILPPLENQIVGMTYDTAIKYVLEINWSDASNTEPTVKYYQYNANATNGLGSEITDILNNPFTITNKYNSEEASDPVLDFGGKKTVNGGALRADDSFTFALYETDASFSIVGLTAKQTKTVTGETANGAFTFKDITFTTPGTKYLVIRELAGNADGIGYDNTQYHITVDVLKKTQNNKTVLEAHITHIHKVGHGDVNADQLNFNNTYTINGKESVVVKGEKNLIGRTLVEGEFTFGIYEGNSTTPLYTVTNDKDENFTFPAIEYNIVNLTSLNETHTYTIKELIPDGDKKGVTYNSDGKTEYTLVVKLEDNGNGGVKKTVELDGNTVTDVQVAFENIYTAADTSLTLSGTKTLENKNDGQFTFHLYETADSKFTLADGMTPLNAQTTVANGTGNYSFVLSYTSQHRGYHYYVLKESVPTQTNGVYYDSTEYHITVNVVDNGHGEMEAHVMSIVSDHISGTVTSNTLNFVNKYIAAPTEYAISGNKILKYKTLENEMFEFRLSNDEGEITTVKNDANGNFTFPAQRFETAGEHKLYVEEVNGGSTIKGIAYDNTKYTVTIPVLDDGIGQLYVDKANIKIEKNVGGQVTTASEVAFVNAYNANATDEIYIEGTKQIIDATLKGDDFEFELHKSDSTFQKGDFVKSAKNLAGGSFKFDKALTFEKADKYYFIITEKKGTLDYIVYDETVYGVVITVSDDGEGKLHVEKKEIFTVSDEGNAAAEKVAFINKYDPADKRLVISGEKLLENRNLSDHEFKFFLYAADSNYKVADDAAAMEAWNKADGSITFEELTFDKTGTYYFVVVEDSNTTAPRVTNDNTVYQIALEIKDDKEGKLYEASRTITKVGSDTAVEKIVFKNVYTPVPPPHENPKTGDETNLVLWIALLCVSGGGILFTLVLGKKKKDKKDAE